MTPTEPQAAPTAMEAMKRLEAALVFLVAATEEANEAAAEVLAALALERSRQQ